MPNAIYIYIYIYIYIFFLIFGRSDRPSTAGHGYGKCKKILACEAQSAQQPNMETCKNAKKFAIVLQYCPKGRTALQYNGIKKIVFLMFSSSLSSLIISRSFFLSLSFFFPTLSSSNSKTLPSFLLNQHGGNNVGGLISFCGGGVGVVSHGQRGGCELWQSHGRCWVPMMGNGGHHQHRTHFLQTHGLDGSDVGVGD